MRGSGNLSLSKGAAEMELIYVNLAGSERLTMIYVNPTEAGSLRMI